MRQITKIIIHCSATPEGADISASQIDKWHRRRGFKSIGYHFVIRLDGTIEPGRDISLIGAHCKGHNAASIGICYIGGVDKNGKPKDTRTPAQSEALRGLVGRLKESFPEATVHGHNEFSSKACPSFDVSRNL